MLDWAETSTEVMQNLNYTKVGQVEDIQQH